MNAVPSRGKFTRTGLTLDQARKQTVKTVVGELAVHTVGDGPQPMVLWPSIFTDHRIYDGLVARLSHLFRFASSTGRATGPAEAKIASINAMSLAARCCKSWMLWISIKR